MGSVVDLKALTGPPFSGQDFACYGIRQWLRGEAKPDQSLTSNHPGHAGCAGDNGRTHDRYQTATDNDGLASLEDI